MQCKIDVRWPDADDEMRKEFASWLKVVFIGLWLFVVGALFALMLKIGDLDQGAFRFLRWVTAHQDLPVETQAA